MLTCISERNRFPSPTALYLRMNHASYQDVRVVISSTGVLTGRMVNAKHCVRREMASMDQGGGVQSLFTVSMPVSYMSIFVYPCSGKLRVMKPHAENLCGYHIHIDHDSEHWDHNYGF
jgi:hypothetical protein